MADGCIDPELSKGRIRDKLRPIGSCRQADSRMYHIERIVFARHRARARSDRFFCDEILGRGKRARSILRAHLAPFTQRESRSRFPMKPVEPIQLRQEFHFAANRLNEVVRYADALRYSYESGSTTTPVSFSIVPIETKNFSHDRIYIYIHTYIYIYI